MSFQLSTFVFIAATLLLFYLRIPGFRLAIPIIASLFFCYALDKTALAVLLLVTMAAYGAGLALDRITHENLRKILCGVCVSVLVIFLLAWKYISGIEWRGYSLIIPVGLSFYTFQAISYISDIYKREYKPEIRPDRFLLYMSWFPKLVSGPIERADPFLKQVERLVNVRLFDGQRIIRAVSYVVWGLYLKLMIADRAAEIVDGIFVKYEQYGSIMLICGSLLYTIQIYCDFAGYTDIAMGISSLFGLELTQNFRTPYLSQNITEFWRSWHISLSSFLRDYVYIPLGGNRKGKMRKYFNTMLVFLACGIWHGRGLSFIVWGALHGMYSVTSDMLKSTRLSFLLKGAAGTIMTFCCVSFAWIFFRAESLGTALRYILAVFTSVPVNQSIEYEIEKTGSSPLQVIILLIALVILVLYDTAAHKKNSTVPEILIEASELKRDASFMFLAVIVLIFGIYGNAEVKDFIYMNF